VYTYLFHFETVQYLPLSTWQ